MDWKWNSTARPLVRVAAAIVGLLSLSMGALILFKYTSGTLAFHSTARAGIAMVIVGIAFIVVAARGRLLKRDIG